MIRYTTAIVAILTLASCAHLPTPGRTTEGPEILQGARYIGETWCSDGETGPRTVWICRVYDRGGRIIVGFYHALTGQLLALAERIGDGPQVRILWRAAEEPAEAAGRMEL